MERQKVFWVVLSVSVFVVVVLVAGAFLLRPKPTSTPGAVTPLSDGGTQVYEYQAPAVSSSSPQGTTETMHFYIGEGQQTPSTGQPGATPAPSAAAPSAAAPAAATPAPAGTTPAPVSPVPAAPAPAVASAAPRAAAPAAVSRPAPKPVRTTEYWIQTGSYRSQTRAEDLAALLTDKGLNGRVFSFAAQGSTWYRVRVGPYANRGEADKFLSEVKKLQGLESSYVSQVAALKPPVN
jgi:cell division protein FtsN